MNVAPGARLTSLLFLCVACDGGTGFRLPESSAESTRLTGRALWSVGRPAAQTAAFWVVDGTATLRVTTGVEGDFTFEELPAGPGHVVINAGDGFGHVRAALIHAGGRNDAGELVLGPLHLQPEVFGMRGVGAEERWSWADHSISTLPDTELEQSVVGGWFVGVRTPSNRLESPSVVAISTGTGEERELMSHLDPGVMLRPSEHGVVLIEETDTPIRIVFDGERVVGPRLPAPDRSRWHALATTPGHVLLDGSYRCSTYTSLVMLDSETLEHELVPAFDGQLEVHASGFAPQRPFGAPPPRVSPNGRYFVVGRYITDGSENLELRITRVELATREARDLWSGSCAPWGPFGVFVCLAGVDIDDEGRVVAATWLDGARRFLSWAPSGELVELDLRDRTGDAFVDHCGGGGWVSGESACQPRWLGPNRLRFDTPGLDSEGAVASWRRNEFQDGRLVRTLELGVDQERRPLARLIRGGPSNTVEAISWPGPNGFRQIWIGEAGQAFETFRAVTFLPAHHDVVSLSSTGDYVYYLVADPETGYVQLFRTSTAGPEVGDRESR